MKNIFIVSALIAFGFFAAPQASQAAPVPPNGCATGFVPTPNGCVRDVPIDAVCIPAQGLLAVPVRKGDVKSGCFCEDRTGNMYSKVASGVQCPSYRAVDNNQNQNNNQNNNNQNNNQNNNNQCVGGHLQAVAGGVNCVCDRSTDMWLNGTCVPKKVCTDGATVTSTNSCACYVTGKQLDSTGSKCVDKPKQYSAAVTFHGAIDTKLNSVVLGANSTVSITDSTGMFSKQWAIGGGIPYSGDYMAIFSQPIKAKTFMCSALNDSGASIANKLGSYVALKRGDVINILASGDVKGPSGFFDTYGCQGASYTVP